MSRSIHTTRRSYSLERKYQFQEEEVKESRLKQIRDELDHKRSLKQRTQLSRKLAELQFEVTEPFDPTTVPIHLTDAGAYIHYPALPDDLRAVAQRLPVNVMAGIESITLCLGKEYQEENCEGSGSPDVDPFTGRICSDQDGPFYGPPILGIYRPGNCKIFLFAYVYDKKTFLIDVIEPYLRLKMLTTFVHEVAHHDDEMRRTGRGRWLGLNEWRLENYAELQQGEWVETVVIPYLLKAYPKEYHQLLQWIDVSGGVAVTLNQLTRKPRVLPAPGLVWLGYGIDSAVEWLFQNAANRKTPREVMLEFARDLHIGDHYDECLKSLNTLLLMNPDDAEALGIKADTLMRQEKYEEAEITAAKCLAMNPSNLDALEVFCDIYQEHEEWSALEEISSRGIRAAETSAWEERWFLEKNLIASLYLGDYQTAKKDAEALPDHKVRLNQRKQAFLALVAFLAGNEEEAIQIAKAVLVEEKVVAPAKAILQAIITKVHLVLGDYDSSLHFTDYEKDFLSSSGIGKLVDVLFN